MPALKKPTYLSDEGTLLQLILAEYMAVCRELKPAVKMIQAERKKQNLTKNHLNAFIDDIGEAVLRVGGAPIKNNHQVPWKNQNGHLETMEEFCLSLVVSAERSKPAYLSLYSEVGEAKALAKQCLKILKLWECQNSLYFDPVDIQNAHQTFEFLRDQVKKIGGLIAEVLQFTTKNENVVLYFLRNQSEIERTIGKKFAGEILRSAPKKQELIRRFKSRGFTEVCEEIEQLL